MGERDSIAASFSSSSSSSSFSASASASPPSPLSPSPNALSVSAPEPVSVSSTFASLSSSAAYRELPHSPLFRARQRLLQFLRDSGMYDVHMLLGSLPAFRLLDERAVLLSRLHRHEQVLFILVHLLRDVKQAEDYCHRIFSGGTEAGAGRVSDGRSKSSSPGLPYSGFPDSATGGELDNSPRAVGAGIYLVLLKVYLHPPSSLAAISDLLYHTHPSHPHHRPSSMPFASSSSLLRSLCFEPPRIEKIQPLPQVQRAISLITRYNHRIDSSKAVQMLSSELPIRTLLPLFNAVLSKHHHTRRSQQIVRCLQKSDHLAVKAEFLALCRERLVVERGSVCAACEKKLNSSVMAMGVSGQLLCYVCHTRAQKEGRGKDAK